MQYSDELTKGISTGSEWCASLPSWTACLILLPNYSDFEGFHVPNTTYIAIFTTQKAVLNKHISQNMGFVWFSNFHYFHSIFFADFPLFPITFSSHYTWVWKAGNILSHQSFLPHFVSLFLSSHVNCLSFHFHSSFTLTPSQTFCNSHLVSQFVL